MAKISKKVAVFDIDGTLAKTEEVIASPISERLRKLEEKGVRLVLISGRTASYLAGLARGIGIKYPLVAGENGGVIFNPASHWEVLLDKIPPQRVAKIKKEFLLNFPDIWFQPNQTMVTIAPFDHSLVEAIYHQAMKLKQVEDNRYKLNKYDDSVEIMPKNNSKGRALAVIKEKLQVKTEEVIVFGNTEVDIPMKDEAGDFIFIGNVRHGTDMTYYSRIEEALNDQNLREVLDERF